MRNELPDHVAASLSLNEKAPLLAALLAQRQPVSAGKDDARSHFDFLAHALEFGRPRLFSRYVAWAKPTFASRGVPPDALARHLQAMEPVLQELLPRREAAIAAQYVRAGIDALPGACESLDASLGAISPGAQAYLACLLASDTEGARKAARRAMEGGTGLPALYLEVLAPAMNEVGLLWQSNRISVAQEHYCAGVTQMVMAEAGAVKPAARGGRTAVVACVAGEQHAMGSRMVADLLDMAGWRTLWLGASTPCADLLRMVVEVRADLLALSCSHAPCLHDLVSLIAAIRVLPECRHVKVMVGGYAFDGDGDLWRDVGADAYAGDARAAAAVAQELAGTGPR